MKKKVGVIGLKGLPAFGGAATVGENLIRELSADYDFTVYAVSSHTSFSGLIDGYEQIVFRKFFVKQLNIFFYYIRSALHCLFARKFDLIHLHHVDGAFILPLLRLKYKVILTSHAQPYVNDKWPELVKYFFRMNERIAFLFADRLTAVSMPLSRIYEGKTKKTIHFIPNGINLEPLISKTTDCPDNYMLFAAGRIIPLKGLHTLLQAMRKGKIAKKLVIIGDLSQMPAYRSDILNESRELNVEFIPLIRQKEVLLRYVQQADFFIFPSLSENMSLMLMEAASLQIPVICSDIEANRAVFNEQEMLFFRTNDSQDLLDKLNFALHNREALQCRAKAAYLKLVEKYQWRTIAGQYKNLYKSLAD